MRGRIVVSMRSKCFQTWKCTAGFSDEVTIPRRLFDSAPRNEFWHLERQETRRKDVGTGLCWIAVPQRMGWHEFESHQYAKIAGLV